MKRLLEPELMIEPEQVCAYANADFDEPHSNFIKMLGSYYNSRMLTLTSLILTLLRCLDLIITLGEIYALY